MMSIGAALDEATSRLRLSSPTARLDAELLIAHTLGVGRAQVIARLREPLPNGALMRKPFLPYVEALHGWQKRLNRPTALDEDPFGKAVDLEDVRKAAREMQPKADPEWH